MARVRAAVLAAGRGIRMGGEEPKTLIPVDGHQCLLHYILTGLRQAGVDDVVIVTGFRPQRMQEVALQNADGLEISFIRNARYADWGNFHSVRLALDQSPGARVLVINSDVAVNPAVYSRVIEGSGDLVLAVQRRPKLDPEDMRVELSGDRVVDIGKDLKPTRSHGEFCGISLLQPPAARAYSEIASDAEWINDTSIFYEGIYAAILSTVDPRWIDVGGDEYAEVDSPADWAAAEQVIRAHGERSPAETAKSV